MSDERIRISPDNPWYWEVDGEPTLLVGASDDDCLYQWFGDRLTDHLDAIASVGGNYVRNTMSIRFEDSVFAFEEVGDDPTAYGKTYDLDDFNDEHWNRLETFLAETAAHDIVVELTLWDQHDFGSGMWAIQPWNPENNVNYTVEETGVVGGNEFFATVHNDVDAILEYQERFVDNILEIALPHDHVIYNVNNESTVPYKVHDPAHYDSAWERYWARYVRDAAEDAGVAVDISNMIMRPGHSVAAAVKHPELYSYVELSQLNQDSQGKVGDAHWEALQDYRAIVDALGPRPINNVKVYGAVDPNPSAGTAAEAVERFWRLILGGAASARFHRVGTYGLGLVDRTKSSIRSVRMLESEVDLFGAQPANYRIASDEDTRAYAAATEGEDYVVYLPEGGEVALNLGVTPEAGRVRWLDVGRSAWFAGADDVDEQWIDLEAPGQGNWIAAVTLE